MSELPFYTIGDNKTKIPIYDLDSDKFEDFIDLFTDDTKIVKYSHNNNTINILKNSENTYSYIQATVPSGDNNKTSDIPESVEENNHTDNAINRSESVSTRFKNKITEIASIGNNMRNQIIENKGMIVEKAKNYKVWIGIFLLVALLLAILLPIFG